ncbi:hypothetical protein BZG02_19105 [Labilibaculum filiforme]|uniref:ATP-grasp domain-containing protein n=2 Tax=Labilibaculum filiforme TaxID=1940526 RepID=A0A2N3HQY9_9BACT|nr:hypothetical protein BZG02_19105 [Labilibaculum filiforme]
MPTETAPKLFIYNPTCEMAIANGTVSFMPNKTLTKFEQDLDVFPLFFAEKNDTVLVHQQPDEQFLDLLAKAGVSVPSFRVLSEALVDSEFIKMPKDSLHPWGWSPRIHHIFKPFKESCSLAFLEQANAYWKPEHRELYSRKKALEIGQNAINRFKSSLFIDIDSTAQICTSVSEVELQIKKWKQIVIKAPFSSAGRGIQILRYSTLNKSIIQSINGIIATQGYVMVEAFLNKLFDFSLQYYCNGKGEISYLGLGFFETDSKGQYLSNYLGGIPDKMKEVITEQLVSELENCMTKTLLASDIASTYTGYFGVDCLLVLDREEKIKVHPCLEINLRYNMSTLALFLNKNIHSDCKGDFKIFHQFQSTFDQFHLEMIEKHPFKMQNGKWLSGYLPLVSPFQNKTFGAYLLLKEC